MLPVNPAFAFLLSLPVLAFAGAAALGAVLWFVGPLIGLESEPLRLAVIAGLFVVAGGAVAWSVMRRKKAEKALADGMTAAADPTLASREEQAALQDRFVKALDLLKKAKGGKLDEASLYELPWYIIIGPPGSGKTTALAHSGLRFPLAGEGGQKPLKGIGGTRQCDWWFTDEAVMIDTAGRYTTQDSDAGVDQAGWKRFLDLLKENRPRQPINGALVAISIADLAARDPAERLSQAHAVRQRLRELADVFGVRFPIYVLFTKTDLVAGFTEFFDPLSAEERRQVFGMTFPLDDGTSEGGVVGRFGPEFDRLVLRLNDRMVDRVNDESDHERRGQVFAFPTQFASLKEPASEFLTEVFLPSRFEARPLLRGVYFTSGTQEGTPFDRLMGALVQTFGLRRTALRAFSGQGRSFFLERLLREVAFREAGIVGTNPKVEGQRKALRRAAFATLAIVVAGAAGVWGWSYLQNERLVAAFDEAIADYRRTAETLPPRVSDGDLRPILPVLEKLRTLPAGYETLAKGGALAPDFGLYQGEKLAAAGDAAYRRALAGLLAPRLVHRAHTALTGLLDGPTPTGEEAERLLAVYLGLSGNGQPDADLARLWLGGQLVREGFGPEDVKRADAHLTALLERPIPRLELSQPLIERARALVREQTPAARAYARLKRNAAAAQLAAWRPIDHGGPEMARVFQRPSGAKLTDGIPGLYTYQGFHTHVLPKHGAATQSVRDSAWLLGEQPAADGKDTLDTELMTLYLRDYAAAWDELLGDMALVPTNDLRQVATQVNLLAGGSSPMKQLLQAIAQQTTLARLPQVPGAPAAPVTGAAAALAQAAVSTGPLALATQIVDSRFRLLNDFSSPAAGAPARIDDLSKSLEMVFTDLSRLLGSRDQGQGLLDATQGGSDAFLRLNTEAASVPYPVKGWVEQILRSHSTLAVGGARARLNGEWQTNVLPWCRRSLDNRYPFQRGAATEVALDDFVRLFAPGGLIDGFFETRLRPYVDTSADPWRWQRVDGVDLGISPSVLVQFQKAARIRDAFFTTGGKEPGARFDLKAVSIDPGLDQVAMTVDGQALTFAKGSPQAFSVQWPGSSGARQVLMTFVQPQPAIPLTVNRDGPWAFLRLLDGSGLRATKDPTRYNFGVSDGVHSAVFEVRAGSALNPLNLPDLKDFRCPPQL